MLMIGAIRYALWDVVLDFDHAAEAVQFAQHARGLGYRVCRLYSSPAPATRLYITVSAPSKAAASRRVVAIWNEYRASVGDVKGGDAQ